MDLLAKIKGLRSVIGKDAKLGSQPNKIHSTIKKRVSTGSHAVDILLGGDDKVGRGVPVGRILDVFGDPSEGKSTLAESIIVQFQKAGGMGVLFLAEPAIDLGRLEKEGCNIDELVIVEPPCLEDGLEQLQFFLMNKEKDPEICNLPCVIVYDTLAHAPLKSQITTGVFKGDGLQAKPRYIRKGLETISLMLARSSTTLIAVSQAIANFTPYAPPSTSGGSGVSYWSSARLYIKRRSYIQSGGKPDGIVTNVRIQKSKIDGCLVQRKLPIYIRHTTGIDPVWSLFYALEKSGIFPVKKGWFNIELLDYDSVNDTFLTPEEAAKRAADRSIAASSSKPDPCPPRNFRFEDLMEHIRSRNPLIERLAKALEVQVNSVVPELEDDGKET